jgi:predicted alpha/beta-hydrolase family hydrolase
MLSPHRVLAARMSSIVIMTTHSKAQRLERELVSGWLYQPDGAPIAAMALFHGAGSNCESPLLIAVAEAFRDAGWLVFRGNLPYRQQRPTGPPRGNSRHDREGIRRAAKELRALAPGVRLCLTGHSYGGRQCSMLASEDPTVADALLLLSYPLHPPREPAKPRTEHFAALRVPALFVHGTRDTFGTIAELEDALRLIPAKTVLLPVEGAPHGLPPSIAASLPARLQAIME